MKKILFVFAFALIGVVGFAQNGLTVKAGLNLNKVLGEGRTTDFNVGYHVGATYDYYFADIVGIETGLLLDTRGSKSETGKTKTTILGLTIPVLAKVKIDVESLAIVLNVGPFANIGLTGLQDAKDVKFGEDKGLNRFTFGLNFGGGVEVGKFVVGAGYDLGLTEVGKDSGLKYHTIKIGVGYKF